ncbi:hypothetical protein AB0H87_26670, partial [Asanoa sp. NPDC050611]
RRARSWWRSRRARTTAEEYVRQLLADHVVHGWDLAVATGADRDLDARGAVGCPRPRTGRPSVACAGWLAPARHR